VEPDASLNLPLLQGWHSVAPLVLDLPAVHFSHDSLGGSLPLVPAAHALKPLGFDASILDPSGTTTDEEPPLATTSPAVALLQVDCFGSGCKYPNGHWSQLTFPSVLENLPGGQGMHDTELTLLVYDPGSHAVLFAVLPLQ
jgi:hypothetical protein